MRETEIKESKWTEKEMEDYRKRVANVLRIGLPDSIPDSKILSTRARMESSSRHREK